VKKNCICVFIACAICAFIGCRSTAAVSAQNSDAKAKDQKTHRRSAAEQPVDMQTPSVADKDKPNVRLAGKDTASPEIETPSLPTPEGGTAEASESGEAGGMAAEANSELALISEEPAVMLEEAVSPFFMNDSMPVETAAAKAAEQMSAAEAEPEAVAGAEKNARTPSVADEDKPQVRLAGKDTASPEIETPSLPAPEGETAKDSESGEVDGMAAESEKSKTLSDESAAPIVEADSSAFRTKQMPMLPPYRRSCPISKKPSRSPFCPESLHPKRKAAILRVRITTSLKIAENSSKKTGIKQKTNLLRTRRRKTKAKSFPSAL